MSTPVDVKKMKKTFFSVQPNSSEGDLRRLSFRRTVIRKEV
jgi:hypothetical protein